MHQLNGKASTREIKTREDSLHVIVLIFQHSLTMALRKAIECWDLYPPHTAQVEAVLAEQILSQWLGQNICNLIIGTHRKYLDETDGDVLTEVMVAQV
jgi:hypothetical protein